MLPPIGKTINPAPTGSGIRSMFSSLRIAASGLDAHQFALKVGANNLANIETTRTAEGGPYQRQTPIIEAVGTKRAALGILGPASPDQRSGNLVSGGVRIAGVTTDQTPGPMIYDPGHPDADAAGYVRMPNVDMTTELLGLAEARDGFNANTTVFEAVSSMLRKGLKI